MNINNIIHIITAIILPLLFAITLHEAAHGYVANKLGDKTALMLGRVSLNPIKHIDLFGTIILPILMLVLSKFSFAFGWAKPVPVNSNQLRHPKRDMALVAIAGPFANLLMAIFWAGIAKVGLLLGTNTNDFIARDLSAFLFTAGTFGISINIILMVLNLIPIPPLDGSRIVASFLSSSAARAYERIERYGLWILLGLIVFGLLGRILTPPVMYLTTLIRRIFGLG